MYKTLCVILVLTPAIVSLSVLDEWFDRINQDVVEHNKIAAKLTWESTINPQNEKLSEVAAIFQAKLIGWQHRTCDGLGAINPHLLNSTQMRQTYLLCRGPKYTVLEARKVSELYEELRTIYDIARICITSPDKVNKSIVTEIETAIDMHSEKEAIDNDVNRSNENTNHLCLESEEEFESLMKKSKNKHVLEWLWTTWRNRVGIPMKKPFRELIHVENYASRRNGYSDIGSAWRDELEIPVLIQHCRELYSEIQPLYELLHGVARFYIRRQYGDSVPEKGPIPAHLMGSLWGDNWDALVDLVVENNLNFDERIKDLKWSVKDMVKRAEDLYRSFGFPELPEAFWKKSVFSRKNNDTRCHGTAADMFTKNDFRLLYCSGSDSTLEDFNVIHHELGHIYYFMAYENQPGLFRQASSALHEAAGEAAALAAGAAHRQRLRLLADAELFAAAGPGGADAPGGGLGLGDVLLLKKAFNHIPQLPFALMLEEFRWTVFEGAIDESEYNRVLVELMMRSQGLAAPGRREDARYFDAGAKFHVADNTPYIRYYLAGILRYQLFEAMCAAGVRDHRAPHAPRVTGTQRALGVQSVPVGVRLSNCDVYGSRAAGDVLRDIMSRGASAHWREILYDATGQKNIKTDSLRRYYEPLRQVLVKLVEKHNIPIGW